MVNKTLDSGRWKAGLEEEREEGRKGGRGLSSVSPKRRERSSS